MTRALITNDDGIDAPGLHALARSARAAGLEVTVAAPARQSSGASASIMAEDRDGRIAVERRTLAGLEDLPAFAVHGGPGLIALIAAHGAFGEPPEVVLSGVNHGANVGRAVIHSGTVGAALTGGLNRAWAVAVSLDVGMRPVEFHWDVAAEAALSLLPDLLERPPGTVLNVNAPNSASNRGIRESSLAPFGIVQTTLSEREEHHIRLAVEDLPHAPEPGTDAAHLADGWVTVTGLESVTGVPLGLR
ncbi:5'/3'-nucleotidase SurE [Microbacterium sp. zg-Y818]|uniref:5'/3'-nucleotidase SurE n=1 Tax=unclassified Microbacterium TaxID=2609290 RepID=UPI00214BB632|nr:MULTISPECIES: 5'/3'-nucleotidase SurE [unclassified Microbacterium]MCR2800035.1 5'/3'-nucleotidase SurE [Microbacterium sp. zg.Y818]WIM22010.1 5'/3'-nucleotidase SurE [Microbacterium sp. zg-Y818]